MSRLGAFKHTRYTPYHTIPINRGFPPGARARAACAQSQKTPMATTWPIALRYNIYIYMTVYIYIYMSKAGNALRRMHARPHHSARAGTARQLQGNAPPAPTPHDVVAARNEHTRAQHAARTTRVRGTPLQQCSGHCAEPGWPTNSHGPGPSVQNAGRRACGPVREAAW